MSMWLMNLSKVLKIKKMHKTIAVREVMEALKRYIQEMLSNREKHQTKSKGTLKQYKCKAMIHKSQPQLDDENNELDLSNEDIDRGEEQEKSGEDPWG